MLLSLTKSVCFFFKIFIEVELIYNVMLISGAQYISPLSVRFFTHIGITEYWAESQYISNCTTHIYSDSIFSKGNA